jgi:uncharacterized membrane protein HdeD (DUF308 family)
MSVSIRFTLVVVHGIAMLALGLAILYIRATMTNIVFEAFGSIFALLLIAASLLFSSVLDWVCAAGCGPRHIRELRRYLFLSLLTAGVGLFFVIYPAASIEMLCYLSAAYALLLGIGKLQFAYHWECEQRQKRILYVFGAITICFSGGLAGIASQEERAAISMLGAYSIFVGIQMLVTVSYLYRVRMSPVQKTIPEGQDLP